MREIAARKPESNYDFELAPDWMSKHTGQSRAWAAKTRKVIGLAGWQAGKTDFAVQFALRQLKRRGPGEAIVAAPSYPLLTAALQPRLVKSIESRGLGEHKKGDNLIIVPYDSLRRVGYEGDEKGDLTIFLKHTQRPQDVEAVTALWFVGDEVGQMPDEVLEAIDGRTSATGGDVCLISRPYFDNKFRQMCESPDHETTVVSFASWDNPGWRADLRNVPGALEQELERLKRSMPLWRFDMKYGGRFTRPAGAILDNWSDEHEYQGFLIPGDWKRFTFHDFGQVHAFVLCVAEHPTERDSEGYPVLYVYREFFPNQSIDTKDLVAQLRKLEQADLQRWAAQVSAETPTWRPRGIGGNKTGEQGWRQSYTASGIPVEEPLLGEQEPQIDRLYACIGRGGLKVSKDCPILLQMMKSWSWEIDDGGEPIPGKIKDDAKYHGPAALRYGVSQLRPIRRDPDKEKVVAIGSREWHNQFSSSFEEVRTDGYGA